MAADAEVKLNFTASIEQARAAIAEISAAMEKLQATGGVMRPEDAALMNEMQGQLAAYKARVDELDAAYRALQASGGEANTAALEQIKELQQEVETLTKQQNALVDKVVGLQVENNKLKGGVQEVGKEAEKAGAGGVKVVRSMRGAIANFVRDLARGKLAVRELGLALKGLAYSTVVLGAIQLAMEGIMMLWEGIKSMFGQSKEEMEAAEKAAEKAKEALKDAHDSAVEAGKEYQALKDKFDKDEAAQKLKDNAERVAALFAKQREEQEKTLGLMQIQAELEAKAIKDKAEREAHEIRLQQLELKRKKLLEEISAEEYANQMAELEARGRGIQRQGRVDAAAAKVRGLESQQGDFSRRLSEAEQRRALAVTAQNGRVSDNELALAEKRLAEARARLAEAETAKVTAIKTSDGYLGDDYFRALNDIKEYGEQVRQLEIYYRQQKELNKGYAEGEEVIKQQNKLISELKKKLESVTGKLTEARGGLKTVREDTFLEALRDEEVMDAERAVREAEAEAKRRAEEKKRKEAAKKPAKVSGELKEAVKQIVKDAKKAYNTDGDQSDDADVMRAVAELLRDRGSEMSGYKDGLKELLTVCSMLKVKGDSNSAEMARLRTEIKSLKRRTSQQ